MELGLENILDNFSAVIKNLFQLPADKQPMHQPPGKSQRHQIPNLVGYHSSALFRGEGMRMMPEAIWTFELFINKSTGRIVQGDNCPPVNTKYQ